MTKQHTPGPWDTDTSTGWVGLRGNYRVIARVRRTSPHGAADLGEEGNANARLIAAAPDLLEALRFIAENDVSAPGLAQGIAAAAIAKATTTNKE